MLLLLVWLFWLINEQQDDEAETEAEQDIEESFPNTQLTRTSASLLNDDDDIQRQLHLVSVGDTNNCDFERLAAHESILSAQSSSLGDDGSRITIENNSVCSLDAKENEVTVYFESTKEPVKDHENPGSPSAEKALVPTVLKIQSEPVVENEKFVAQIQEDLCTENLSNDNVFCSMDDYADNLDNDETGRSYDNDDNSVVDIPNFEAHARLNADACNQMMNLKEVDNEPSLDVEMESNGATCDTDLLSSTKVRSSEKEGHFTAEKISSTNPELASKELPTIQSGIEVEHQLIGAKRKPGLNQPASAKLADFDTIMKSRKTHTDTIDMAASAFGDLGHREQKIRGKKLSKDWELVHGCVSKREYVTFKDKGMSTSFEQTSLQ